jgi:phosphohistidine phosphatase
MVRYLYLLRHAKSSWDDPRMDDHDRPLAPRGKRAMNAIARHVRKADVRPELILCSSAARARQTLDRVLPAMAGATAFEVEDGLYTFDGDDLLRRLREVPASVGSVMLVGHNPALQELALTLAGRGDALDRMRSKLPTGALATLRIPRATWHGLRAGSAELVSLVAPKDLA